jgi:hypothetical protein
MTIAAQLIVQTVSVDRLQDPNATKWPIPELCRSFNRCQRAIFTLRPDLGSARVTLALVAGALQTLASGSKMLLNVERNTGGNKRAVKMPKNGKAIVDAQIPNWRSLAGVTEILEAYYDERDPLHFEVYPPAASSGASLELVTAVYPTDITIQSSGTYADVTGNFGLQDIAMGAQVELMCAEAYLKDANFAAQGGRASTHLTLAANLLGVELKSVLQFMPRADDIQGAPATST